MKIVEVPGHGEVEFPDEMSDQDISAAIKKNLSAVPSGVSGSSIIGGPGQQILEGIGHGIVNVGRGVGQALGMIPQSDIDEAKRLDQTLMQSNYAKAGDIAGQVAATLPAMAIPGANTIVGGAAIGSGLGALQPVASDESRLKNIALGGAGGAAGSAITKGLSRVLAPQTSDAAKTLLDEGVKLTPGQIVGGMGKTLEDKLTSIPLIGDMIGSGQRKAQESFNQAAYARALKGIGTPSGAVGREGVADVSSQLGSAYDKLLPQMRFKADPQFTIELQTIQEMASQLPPQQAAQFEKILQDKVVGKMTSSGLMNGDSLQSVQSELSRLSKGYKGDTNFDNRQLGDALSAIQDSIRANLTRANPEQAAQLAKINEGYANYARIRDAASRQGSKEGIFSPAQLAAAVRAGDKTVGKGGYAKGDALLQDLTDAGQSVIGNKYPDSGSVGRGLLAAVLGGAGATGHPVAAGVLGAGSLAYTTPGQKIAAALLAKRPDLLRQLAPQVSQLALPVGAATSAGMLEGQ